MLLGKLIVGLTGFFLLLSLTARTMGNTQPPNPALRGFTEGCEDKPQPCWYGIVPGVTTMGEAGKQLITQSFFRLASYTYIPPKELEPCVIDLWSASGWETETVQRLTLNCSEITLGDIIFSLEEPQGLILEGYAFRTRYMRLMVFGNTAIQSSYSSSKSILDKREQFIFLYAPNNTSLQETSSIRKWRGFLPVWRYCQLEKDSGACAK